MAARLQTEAEKRITVTGPSPEDDFVGWLIRCGCGNGLWVWWDEGGGPKEGDMTTCKRCKQTSVKKNSFIELVGSG